MMLFLDTNNRLYLISFDVKGKATWIPLPSSSPGREHAPAPKVSASKIAASATTLKVSSQITLNASHQMSLEPEASCMEWAET